MISSQWFQSSGFGCQVLIGMRDSGYDVRFDSRYEMLYEITYGIVVPATRIT